MRFGKRVMYIIYDYCVAVCAIVVASWMVTLVVNVLFVNIIGFEVNKINIHQAILLLGFIFMIEPLQALYTIFNENRIRAKKRYFQKIGPVFKESQK